MNGGKTSVTVSHINGRYQRENFPIQNSIGQRGLLLWTKDRCQVHYKNQNVFWNTCVRFFSYEYNLLPKISILRSSKRNINIWKKQLHNITRASAFFMHNYVNLFCIGNRITQSGKNQCVAEERIRVEVLWNIKQNVKNVCNNYHLMGITFIEQFNWFRKFKALMLFNVTLKLLQNFCLQEKKVGNIFFLKQKCRRGNANFFSFLNLRYNLL